MFYKVFDTSGRNKTKRYRSRVLKARSHCAIATAIFLVVTDELYRIQQKYSYCAIATIALSPKHPISEVKTNDSRKSHSVNGPYKQAGNLLLFITNGKFKEGSHLA